MVFMKENNNNLVVFMATWFFHKKIENCVGYILGLCLWFCSELWLWILRTTLTTIQDLLFVLPQNHQTLVNWSAQIKHQYRNSIVIVHNYIIAKQKPPPQSYLEYDKRFGV
jgi:hypothetical protein